MRHQCQDERSISSSRSCRRRLAQGASNKRLQPLLSFLTPPDYFNRNEPGIFAPLRDMLLTLGDFSMHLADVKSYLVELLQLWDNSMTIFRA